MPDDLLRQSRQNREVLFRPPIQLIMQAPGYLCHLAQAIRRFNPTVLYTNGIKHHIIGALLRPFLRVPMIWHLRDNWGGPLVGLLADFGPHRIIANSRATATFLQKDMKFPQKVVVVHNSVDVAEYSPEGDTVHLETAGPKVGLVATLARWKGHTLLLQAAERILSEFPGAIFYFIGGSIYDTVAEIGYEDELRKLIVAKGLSEQVVMTGFQPEMAPWYRALDIVVNASLQPEPFGRTLLEAMSCGKAVVGPNAGGIPEFVQHGRSGLLYEMGQVEALTTAMLNLCRDPSLRRKLGTAGRETAVQHFGSIPQAETITRLLLKSSRQ
jgi:glycosyltransferase involved in cell wall biosynthesis